MLTAQISQSTNAENLCMYGFDFVTKFCSLLHIEGMPVSLDLYVGILL